MDNNNPADIPKKKKRLSAKKSLLLMLLIFFVMINIFGYVNIRSRWVNKNHPYPKAKEYYALGEMVFLYRKGLNIIFKVDNPVMYPLNKLQEAIYNRGIRYIPETDGERAIWKYKLDLYFYGRRHYMPNDNTPERFEYRSPLRARILDDTWWALETLATKPMADPVMNEMRYKIFPLVAVQYVTNYKLYYGNERCHSITYASFEDRERFPRLVKMIDWLVENRKQWDAHPSVLREIRNRQRQIELFYYVGLLQFSEDVILKRMHDTEFYCDDSYTRIYVDKRIEFIDYLERSIGTIKKGQLKLAYDLVLGAFVSKKLIYLMHTHCNVPKDTAYPDDAWVANKSKKEPWNYGDRIEKAKEKRKIK